MVTSDFVVMVVVTVVVTVVAMGQLTVMPVLLVVDKASLL